MTQEFKGVLEIDYDRGVIYFHDSTNGITKLRICNLPKPIPQLLQLDITHMFGTNWFTPMAIDNLIENVINKQEKNSPEK